MRFIRKSLIRRLFIHLFLAGLIISFVANYLYYYQENLVSVKVLVPASIGFFLLYTLAACYFDFIKPLKTVLTEMQTVLTGGIFKKIYSTRIDEVGILAYFFNKVTEGFGQVSFDIKDRQRMLNELNLAAQLQRDILPSQTPHVPGLQIAARTQPATEIGGDIFNFITIKDRTYIYIGDATGHGTVAGIVMTIVNALITVFSDTNDSAYEVLVNVNKYLKKWLKRSVFMTLVMLCWDHKEQRMTYCGAGHEHIIVYHTETGECEAVLSGGIALGMVPDNSKLIKEQELRLGEHDYVVLYSDGITEAKATNGELYGLERLRQDVVEYAPQYSADGVNYHIARDVSAFMSGVEQKDDMTLIVMRKDQDFKPGEPGENRSTNW